MKGTGIVHLMTVLLLQEHPCPLERDVAILALADEEEDSIGANWVRDQRPDLVRGADFLLNEGATIVMRDGKVDHYAVATMEKSVLWLRLSTKGRAGHGSVPYADSASNRMVAALERVRTAQRPPRVTPSVAAFFAAIADRQPRAMRAKLRDLGRYARDTKLMRTLANDPLHGALLKDTVAITGFTAGGKVNVIPGSAEATLDCRLLPGTDKGEFLGWLKKVLADDAIVVEETLYFPTAESPVETELMRGIRAIAQRYDPGAPVLPRPLTSTTDSSVFRRLGLVAYGFEPFKLSEEEQDRQHGADERISEANLERGLRFTYDLVRLLACSQASSQD